MGTAPRLICPRVVLGCVASRVAGRDSPLSHGHAAAYRSLIGSPGSGVRTLHAGRSGCKLSVRQMATNGPAARHTSCNAAASATRRRHPHRCLTRSADAPYAQAT